MNDVVILEGARTAFGEVGGGLRDVNATELGLIATKEALKRSEVEPEAIDNVVFGNAMQTTTDAHYLPRDIALKAGMAIDTPALIVGRICGSGLQSVVSAAQSIRLGESEMAIAGGTENMSMAPFIVRGARWGIPMNKGVLDDALGLCFVHPLVNEIMGGTAENLAEKYNITREEQDEYALRSQNAAVAAQASGRIKEEIVPVVIPSRKGDIIIDTDEHVRAGLSMEKLAKLKPAFRKEGTVTPGNASGINDGASALVLASAKRAEKENRKPLAKILSWTSVGVPPEIMGIGPAPAIRKAVKLAGLTLDQIDLFEINEAFAAQYLAVEKELGLDREKVNVNGGAVAYGHPLAASGNRLTLTILYELVKRRKKYGAISLCIGGGQGIAAVVENLRM